MQDTNQLEQGLHLLVRHARRHPLRWLLPTLLIGSLGFAYALVHQPDWVASQALTVREDQGDSTEWIGRFNEAEQLKHAQETFLELARSPSVIGAALKKLGPPDSYSQPDQWPTPEDVATAQEKIEVAAPNGAEFGTTRMFYLNAADPEPERAIALAAAICDESEQRFKQLRDRQLRDAIAELTNTVELATCELENQTAKLQEMETSAGSDLAELRMLSESFAGDSNLQTTLAEVQQELRQAETTHAANEQLLSLLIAAQEDPSNLVATPNRLLEAQPALRRLKEGLIDAQLSQSQLLGTMSEEHPRVRAAHVAESEIRGHLHRELDVAVRGLRAEQSVGESQIATLSERVNGLQQRLRNLAGMRASYTNQLAEVRQCTASLTSAQEELNDARARLSAGNVVTLVNRVDRPQTGPYAQGPGRSVTAAAGCMGGLLIGFGILLLTMPPVPATPVAATTAAADAAPVAQQAVEAAIQSGAAHGQEPTAQRPATPRRDPLPTRAPAGRSMTLKEALIHCSNANDTTQQVP